MKKRDANVTDEGGSNVPIVRVRSGIRKLTAHECFNTPHTPQTVKSANYSESDSSSA